MCRASEHSPVYNIHSRNDESPQRRAKSEPDTQREQHIKPSSYEFNNSPVMCSRELLLQRQCSVTGIDLLIGGKNPCWSSLFAGIVCVHAECPENITLVSRC